MSDTDTGSGFGSEQSSPGFVDVDAAVLALEAPLRSLVGLGRFNVEDILREALDDVFGEEA